MLRRWIDPAAQLTEVSSTDIQPGLSGVSVRRHRIRYTSGGADRDVGPFYLDLPHHHCTLAQAEHYRRALAARGYTIPADRFAEQYRIATRYIGLRYMWWTLEYWLSDPSQTAWVQHYIGLVTGDGIAA